MTCDCHGQPEAWGEHDDCVLDKMHIWTDEPEAFRKTPRLRVRLQPTFQQYAQAWQDAARLLNDVGAVDWHDPHETTAERALRLRRTRNTGPARPGPQDRKRTR